MQSNIHQAKPRETPVKWAWRVEDSPTTFSPIERCFERHAAPSILLAGFSTPRLVGHADSIRHVLGNAPAGLLCGHDPFRRCRVRRRTQTEVKPKFRTARMGAEQTACGGEALGYTRLSLRFVEPARIRHKRRSRRLFAFPVKPNKPFRL